MKLHEVPNNTKIRVLGEVKIQPAAPYINEGDILTFHHIDGMYSYCTDKDGNVVYLAAWAEVEIAK